MSNIETGVRVITRVMLPVPSRDPRLSVVHSPINPWMEEGRERDLELAYQQALSLHKIFMYLDAGVIPIRTKVGPPPDYGQDAVHCKDQGYVFDRNGEQIALMPRYRNEQRRHETNFYEPIFRSLRIKPLYPPEGISFEVADLVGWHDGGFLLFWGIRTDPEAKPWIEEETQKPVTLLRGGLDYGYHSDIVFKPLGMDKTYPVMWYPDEFPEATQRFIRQSGRELWELTRKQTIVDLWAQSVLTNHTAIITENKELEIGMHERGFDTATINLSQYILLGSAADCLKNTLEWEYKSNGSNGNV